MDVKQIFEEKSDDLFDEYEKEFENPTTKTKIIPRGRSLIGVAAKDTNSNIPDSGMTRKAQIQISKKTRKESLQFKISSDPK